MLVKIGPSTKRNCRRPLSSSSKTLVPVMSEGIRSGVNWMRLKLMSRIRASVLTINVLARPGTPTSRQWPRVKMAAKICSITSLWPMMTFCNSSCMSCRCWLNSWRMSPRLRGLVDNANPCYIGDGEGLRRAGPGPRYSIL